jgi:hypothetical protein
MMNLPLTKQKQKIDQLEKALVDLWDSLSPSLKGKKLLWDKFFNLQAKVRLVNLKIEKDLKNETEK